MPTISHCEACLYHRKQGNSIGTCHRYPPRFAGEGSPKEIHRWKFPLVHEHDWCGEFKPSGQEQAQPGE